MTVRLADVSSWQRSIDWNRASRTLGGGLAKASEGLSFHDSYRVANLRGMHAAGMVTGAYHFARPLENSSVAGARAQAQFYLDAIAGLPVQIHALDLEDQDAGRLGAATLDAWALAWCDYVQAARPGAPVMLYSFTSYLVSTMDGARRTLDKYALWLAAVGRSTAPGTISGHPWVLWQNTWSGDRRLLAGRVEHRSRHLPGHAGRAARVGLWRPACQPRSEPDSRAGPSPHGPRRSPYR